MTILITKDFRHRRANTSYDEGFRTSGDEDFVVVTPCCMVTFTTCDLEIYVILESSVPVCFRIKLCSIIGHTNAQGSNSY